MLLKFIFLIVFRIYIVYPHFPLFAVDLFACFACCHGTRTCAFNKQHTVVGSTAHVLGKDYNLKT